MSRSSRNLRASAFLLVLLAFSLVVAAAGAGTVCALTATQSVKSGSNSMVFQYNWVRVPAPDGGSIQMVKLTSIHISNGASVQASGRMRVIYHTGGKYPVMADYTLTAKAHSSATKTINMVVGDEFDTFIRSGAWSVTTGWHWIDDPMGPDNDPPSNTQVP